MENLNRKQAEEARKPQKRGKKKKKGGKTSASKHGFTNQDEEKFVLAQSSSDSVASRTITFGLMLVGVVLTLLCLRQGTIFTFKEPLLFVHSESLGQPKAIFYQRCRGVITK